MSIHFFLRSYLNTNLLGGRNRRRGGSHLGRLSLGCPGALRRRGGRHLGRLSLGCPGVLRLFGNLQRAGLLSEDGLRRDAWPHLGRRWPRSSQGCRAASAASSCSGRRRGRWARGSCRVIGHLASWKILREGENEQNSRRF